MSEKRKNTRLDLESEIIMKRLDGISEGNASTKIQIKDVSKTGIGFACDYKLDIGAVYECNLTIWTKEVIHCFIEIVRVIPVGDGYNYGGIFIGMTEIDMDRIQIYTTFEEEGLH